MHATGHVPSPVADRTAARRCDTPASGPGQRSHGAPARDVSRAPLYADVVARKLASPPPPVTAPVSPVRAQPAAAAAPPAPALDVAKLSEDVYRHIERRVRIERERRGL